MYSQSVLAEAWILEPSVKLTVQADDNFTLDDRSVSQQEVTAAKVSGALGLSRLTEAVETLGVLRVNAIQYFGDVEETSRHHKIPDKQNVVAYLASSYKTPLSRWGVEAALKNDTILRSVNIFVDPEDTTIEPDDDVDDGLTRVSIDRERFVLKPSFQTNLSERSRILTRYRLNDVTYSNLQGEDLKDFRDHTLEGAFSYKYTPQDDVSLRLRLKQFKTDDDGREYEGYSLTAGWKHRFTQTTMMGADLGSRETEFATSEGEKGRNSGLLLRVSGSKRTGLTRFSGRVGRDLFSSGSGDLVQADEYVLNITRTLSPLLSFSFKSRLFQNRLLRDNNADSSRADRRYVSVRPSITWNFTRWWQFVSTIQYRREKRDGEPEAAVSTTVLLSVIYSKPTTLSD